ncbi:MAG: hypothetical protein QOI02_1827, partial [Actinomycetota bacterium]|nr:hypothetical protein [Actinomycetota bacterium]
DRDEKRSHSCMSGRSAAWANRNNMSPPLPANASPANALWA